MFSDFMSVHIIYRIQFSVSDMGIAGCKVTFRGLGIRNALGGHRNEHTRYTITCTCRTYAILYTISTFRSQASDDIFFFFLQLTIQLTGAGFPRMVSRSAFVLRRLLAQTRLIFFRPFSQSVDISNLI